MVKSVAPRTGCYNEQRGGRSFLSYNWSGAFASHARSADRLRGIQRTVRIQEVENESHP